MQSTESVLLMDNILHDPLNLNAGTSGPTVYLGSGRIWSIKSIFYNYLDPMIRRSIVFSALFCGSEAALTYCMAPGKDKIENRDCAASSHCI